MTTPLRAPERPTALGLPFWALLALALLAAPRVLVHDLDALPDDEVLAAMVNSALAVLPPVAWVWVVVRARVAQPLLTLLAVGTLYGVLLGAIHNLLWDEAYGDSPPRLGGELAGRLSPQAEELLLRVAVAGSSVMVGVAIGLVCGLVALAVRRRR